MDNHKYMIYKSSMKSIITFAIKRQSLVFIYPTLELSSFTVADFKAMPLKWQNVIGKKQRIF